MKSELGRIIELLEDIRRLIGGEQVSTSDFERESVQRRESLQTRADYHRDHAAELFSDVLAFSAHAQRWYEKATGADVVFTPYGWITEKDAARAKIERSSTYGKAM